MRPALPVGVRITEWRRPSVRPSVLFRPIRLKWKLVETLEFSGIFPSCAITMSTLVGRKVRGKGHANPLNFRIDDELL